MESLYAWIGAVGAKITDGACTLSATPTDGTVTYAWQATDVNTADTYKGEYTVTTSGADTFTAPTEKYILVEIEDTL